MKRKRYSEEKIISILKEHEAGASAADLSRRHGVAENSIYRWKAKYGGMEVSDAKRLLGEAELDKAALGEAIEFGHPRPALVDELAGRLERSYGAALDRRRRLRATAPRTPASSS